MIHNETIDTQPVPKTIKIIVPKNSPINPDIREPLSINS